MAVVPLFSFPKKPPENPNPKSLLGFKRAGLCSSSSKPGVSLGSAAISIVSLTLALTLSGTSFEALSASAATASRPVLAGISNTRSWFQFFGSGFSVRVPPLFEDVMEPEDYNAGLSLYGDKVKPKTYAARFASPDRSEILSVVIRPSNQLKITFLEAKDATDLGSLKKAAKLFVPGGANLYSARTIKVKEEEGLRTYYFYEFGLDGQHVALVASVNSGKVYVAGSTAPEEKWEDDGVKLRSAAMSLSVL